MIDWKAESSMRHDFDFADSSIILIISRVPGEAEVTNLGSLDSLGLKGASPAALACDHRQRLAFQFI